MIPRRAIGALTALLLAAVACNGPTSPGEALDLGGRWVGTITYGNTVPRPLTINIRDGNVFWIESEPRVELTGTISGTTIGLDNGGRAEMRLDGGCLSGPVVMPGKSGRASVCRG